MADALRAEIERIVHEALPPVRAPEWVRLDHEARVRGHPSTRAFRSWCLARDARSMAASRRPRSSRRPIFATSAPAVWIASASGIIASTASSTVTSSVSTRPRPQPAHVPVPTPAGKAWVVPQMQSMEVVALFMPFCTRGIGASYTRFTHKTSKLRKVSETC